MTGYTLKPGKIGKKLIAGYQKIEEKFVDAFYRKMQAVRVDIH